jgi:TATA-box binding protein (TBP) (component of TFIID and TFIIIB)
MQFKDLVVSTKTIIAMTNLQIDINKLYPLLNIIDYKVVVKKRGRKKKISDPEPNKDIKEGSIIYIQYRDQIKGAILKKKKNTNKKFFRNALTIIMVLKNADGSNKRVNFKISKNGKFQITGCKSLNNAKKVILYMWQFISKTDAYLLFDEYFQVIYHTVMTNVDFNLGFIVNREALDKYMNYNTNYNSLLETSFGYTGINIKFPITYSLDNLEIPTFIFKNEEWVETVTLYKDIPSKKKKKYNTFLVFHSGNIIMSGMIEELMKPAFDIFQKIISECRDEIEEKLDT